MNIPFLQVDANANTIDTCLKALKKLNSQDVPLLKYREWVVKFNYYDAIATRLINENKILLKVKD